MSEIYSVFVRSLPFAYSLLFIVTGVLTIFLLYRSINDVSYKKKSLYLLGAWFFSVSILAIEGAYSDFAFFPPRLLLLGVLPALLLVCYFLIFRKALINAISISRLTWLHVVRIPVEIGLYLLFTAGAVPEEMTFEGRNLDILSGVTAPFIAILIARHKISKKGLITWNLICLGLLLNIVIHAMVAAPFKGLQQIAFDQPNIAVFFFPYSLLPTLIVPVVLFAHLAALRKLFSNAGN